jgi:hypothetical protein
MMTSSSPMMLSGVAGTKGLPGGLMPSTVKPNRVRMTVVARSLPRTARGGNILTTAKSSSNSMKSSIRPETRWAVRSPASRSG